MAGDDPGAHAATAEGIRRLIAAVLAGDNRAQLLALDGLPQEEHAMVATLMAQLFVFTSRQAGATDEQIMSIGEGAVDYFVALSVEKGLRDVGHGDDRL